ncbi:hypothetical protein PQQ87_08215 [Paraburkholderia nemoris]|uniref:hypothetical protein n=1 Tax=Paraburkholderia nemoris TaxID=2793076 RepID=UPI0038B97B97
MEILVLDFISPLVGFEGAFNTLRVGTGMLKKTQVGAEVFLMDGNRKVVFGRARVTQMESGLLGELCCEHAGMNHTEVHSQDKTESAARLFAYIQKLYGPHIAHKDRRAVVIYLERIE